MWIIKIIKIKCFYPPQILNEHWCIYLCLQIQPRENWFQYVSRVYATAINFPCIITLPAIMFNVFRSIQHTTIMENDEDETTPEDANTSER